MRKTNKPEIKKTASGTEIAAPMSTTFFDGGECWDKDVATADRALVDVADAGTLDEIGESFVDVQAVAVLE